MDISVKNLYKAFGDKKVFEGFSHFFPAGQTTALMGPSGCGKTTLLLMLMGLTPFDKGSITGLDGRKVAAVFQEDRLCENLSAPYNLKMVAPKGTPLLSLHAPLLAAGLREEDLHQPLRELSGGMKRRVAIMRALYPPSDLLIMDEPFQGLDEGTKAQMIALVNTYASQKQMIWVTHSLDEALALGSQVLPMAPLL